MSSETSDAWGVPSWATSSTTGPHPTLIPARDPRRPRTLSLVEPPVRLTNALGEMKRASPPPDLARVASSFALLGALMLALDPELGAGRLTPSGIQSTKSSRTAAFW